MRLERESQHHAEQRAKLDAANRAAIAFRERQRAFWHLSDTLCRVEPAITDPDITDAKLLKAYRSALKRALNSLKD
jgi:hypothetical protein